MPTSVRASQKANRYKTQARTAVMKSKILDAAQQVFAQRGFDNSNLDLVALQANCSRGAIYAHYASKDEVFLELLKEKILARYTGLCQEMENEPVIEQRLAIFRRWLLEQLTVPDWGILTLEYKLYAARRPEVRDNLLRMYGSLGGAASQDLEQLLCGSGRCTEQIQEFIQRMTVLSGMVSSLALEQQLRPELFPDHVVQTMAGTIFDALMKFGRK